MSLKVTLYDRRMSKICLGLVKEVVGGISWNKKCQRPRPPDLCFLVRPCLQGRQGLPDRGEDTAGSDQHHGPPAGPPERGGRHGLPPGRQVQRYFPH